MFVLFHQPRPLLRARATVKYADSSLSTHHRQLRARPRQADVVAHCLRVHDYVGTPVSLAKDQADARYRRFCVSKDELGPVADYPSPLQVFAGHEARGVYKGEYRQVEAIAHGDKTRPL